LIDCRRFVANGKDSRSAWPGSVSQMGPDCEFTTRRGDCRVDRPMRCEVAKLHLGGGSCHREAISSSRTVSHRCPLGFRASETISVWNAFSLINPVFPRLYRVGDRGSQSASASACCLSYTVSRATAKIVAEKFERACVHQSIGCWFAGAPFGGNERVAAYCPGGTVIHRAVSPTRFGSR